MSVAYTYHRYLFDRENYKCYVFRCTDPNHAGLSRSSEPGNVLEMGNADVKNEGQKKGKKSHKLVDELDKVKKKTGCGEGCCKAFGVVLSCVVALVGLAEIAVSVTTAIANKLYSSELSGRLVAYIVLAVTGAVALSVAIYAAVGLFKKNKKSLKVAGIILFLLAVIQAIIIGVSVKVTSKDEVNLAESLRESFNQAAGGNPRHIKIWAATSQDFECCGLFGPEDYRSPNTSPIFPPDVPIYCCSIYNSSQSDLVQNVARQICKSTNQYYKIGCGEVVKNVFEKTASIVMGVTIVLIILEVLLSVHVHITYKVSKKKQNLQSLEAENRAGEAGAPIEQHS